MRTPSQRTGPLASWLSRLGLDARGVAAVEFALILPILIAFLFGLSELQPGYSIKRKIGLLARTVADLTARSSEITTAELKTVFGASSAIMRPYDDTGMTQIVVTSVAVTKLGGIYVGTVEWSCGWNLKTSPQSDDLSKRTLVASVPAGFQNDATKSFILVETLYPYKPTIGYTITGTLKLDDEIAWPIRDAERVKLTGSSLIQGNNCPPQS